MLYIKRGVMRANINIHNENCMDALRHMKNNQFELAIVDPPYGINISVSMGRRKGVPESDYHKFAGCDKEIPSAEYFNELFRVSKNQIIWGGNYMTKHLKPSPCWLIWDKGFSEDVTFAQFEMAWTSFNSSAKKFDKNPNQQNRIHPTQKPVELYKWILQKYAKDGDKILDTHLGSGSIAIACWDMKLDLTAYELDENYFNTACKRLKQYQAQGQLF